MAHISCSISSVGLRNETRHIIFRSMLPSIANQTAADLPSQCSSGAADDVDAAGDDCDNDGDETTQLPSPTATTATKTKVADIAIKPHNTATSTPNIAPSKENVTDGYLTWFTQKNNKGACGTVHSDHDFVCAMDSGRYKSSLCGKHVLIEFNDRKIKKVKNVTVMIADECPTCNNADSIDLSVAAFQALANLSVGLLHDGVTWRMLD